LSRLSSTFTPHCFARSRNVTTWVPPARPAVEVFALRGGIDPALDHGQRLGVAGAQIIFAESETAVADVPGVTRRLLIPQAVNPVADGGEVGLVAGGEEEKHADVSEALLGVGPL
jgi:2-methylisocitrate lyase-like PEP mutase family enzyme